MFCGFALRSAPTFHSKYCSNFVIRNATIAVKCGMMSFSNANWPLAAVCQMTSMADKDKNLKNAKQLIQKAVSAGAKMVFLPEAFDYIAENKEQSVKMSESLTDGSTIKNYQLIAKQDHVWLSLGGFHQSTADGVKLKNSHVVIDDCGKIVSEYNKCHLFDIDVTTNEKHVRLKESDYTQAGESIVPPLATPIGNVGLCICYDLRFPEMSQALRNMGAEILTYPSAFTVVTGQAHWEVLLRNKAIENQCYVIAAAQTGRHNSKRASYGHSMIIDPWGHIVACCKEETGVALAEINLDYLRKVRREMPLQEHRRVDLYSSSATSASFSEGSDDFKEFQFSSVIVKDSQIFYKTPYSIAFVNKKPVVPGHVLAAPRRGARRLLDLSPTEIADLFCCVQRVQKAIEEEARVTSSTISIQDGPEAGQTIEHLHVHILPRRKGDFASNDSVYEMLEKHDKHEIEDHRVIRSEEDMAAEAHILRKRMK